MPTTIHPTVLHLSAVAFVFVGCSGGASGDASAQSSGSSGGVVAAAFLGTYDADYSGTVNQTSPPLPQAKNGGKAVITIVKDAVKDLKVTTTFGSDLTGSSCSATMTIEANGKAVFDPPQQTCSLTYTNGTKQENTNTGDAVVNGSSLILNVDGTYKGTVNAQAYSGTFKGTWNGTKKP
jgi:hypothetical protein